MTITEFAAIVQAETGPVNSMSDLAAAAATIDPTTDGSCRFCGTHNGHADGCLWAAASSLTGE